MVDEMCSEAEYRFRAAQKGLYSRRFEGAPDGSPSRELFLKAFTRTDEGPYATYCRGPAALQRVALRLWDVSAFDGAASFVYDRVRAARQDIQRAKGTPARNFVTDTLLFFALFRSGAAQGSNVDPWFHSQMLACAANIPSGKALQCPGELLLAEYFACVRCLFALGSGDHVAALTEGGVLEGRMPLVGDIIGALELGNYKAVLKLVPSLCREVVSPIETLSERGGECQCCHLAFTAQLPAAGALQYVAGLFLNDLRTRYLQRLDQCLNPMGEKMAFTEVCRILNAAETVAGPLLESVGLIGRGSDPHSAPVVLRDKANTAKFQAGPTPWLPSE